MPESVHSPARCLLLDLDGTLADTAPDFGGALNRLLIRERRLPLTFSELRPLVTDGSAALIRAGFAIDAGDSRFDALREALLNEYAQRVHEHTALFPGFDALLAELEANSIPWGIATNKPSRFTNPLVASMGLDVRASAVVSADDVPRAKPHPDSILRAAEMAGVAPGDCLYVGDSIRDVEAARAAGMRALGAVWGYIAPDDDPETWNADALVYRADDIRPWLNLPRA